MAGKTLTSLCQLLLLLELRSFQCYILLLLLLPSFGLLMPSDRFSAVWLTFAFSLFTYNNLCVCLLCLMASRRLSLPSDTDPHPIQSHFLFVSSSISHVCMYVYFGVLSLSLPLGDSLCHKIALYSWMRKVFGWRRRFSIICFDSRIL